MAAAACALLYLAGRDYNLLVLSFDERKFCSHSCHSGQNYDL